MERYVYNPLRDNEIRLLSSQVDGDQVTWSLSQVSLDEAGDSHVLKFDALSYVWGDLTHMFDLVLGNQKLQIHQNLHEALPYLARRRDPRPIFVDAVCINQRDEKEKIAQIRQMHRIYRQASHVWIWLGCAMSHTAEAISLLPQIVTICANLRDAPPILGSEPTTASVGLPTHLTSPIWQAILHIIKNPWFCRLWIVQEAALAKNASFLTGPHEVAWELLESVMEDMFLLSRLRDDDMKRPDFNFSVRNRGVFIIREFTREYSFRASNSPLLLTAVSCTTGIHYCSDPRDRIWGVLGFLDGFDWADLELHDGQTVTELYTRLCRYLFSHVNPKDAYPWWRLFNWATFSGKRTGLPSWCPDLHQRHESSNGIWDISRYYGCNYEASKNERCVQVGSSMQELILTGVVFDVVGRVHSVFPALCNQSANMNFSDRVVQMQKCEEALALSVLGEQKAHARAVMKSGPSIEIETYWRTMIGDARNVESINISYQTYVEFKTSLDRIKELGDRLGGAHKIEHLKLSQASDYDLETLNKIDAGSGFWRFYMPIISIVNGRRFFSTSAGRFGFSSDTVEPGDLVCIFDGAKTAHTIRSQTGCTNTAERYSLIGEAYVHGMMNGEIDSMDLEKKNIILI
ncbi:heterokaryon incompatibility protein-domain-containing protein [Xylariaceae sp. FL0255]|nr:heterokaryon incompatibility protein-domain-containing protein [Xylariaceae sp. FL0255]